MKLSIEGTLVLDTNMALKKFKLVLRADPFNEKVFTHSTGFFPELLFSSEYKCADNI